MAACGLAGFLPHRCHVRPGFIPCRGIASTANASTPAVRSKAGFYHPGVLVNRAQLDFIKGKVAAGAEPWKSAFEAAKASNLGALDYTPTPVDTVDAARVPIRISAARMNSATAKPPTRRRCSGISPGNKTYAENAIKIMNAWSSTLTGGHKLANGPVQAAWCAEVWPRAAEIIRYTDAGWSAADIAKFKNMLTTQYVPSLVGRLVRERQQGTLHERGADQHRRVQRRPRHLRRAA